MTQANIKNPLFCGIDIGSRTGKIVLIDNSGNLLHKNIQSTIASATKTYHLLLETIPQELKTSIKAAAVTGYGRESVAKETQLSATEITCHFLGVSFLHPEIRTIIDIGGQDSKVITISDEGRIKDFIMNDRCAAGTGRFIEVMAEKIGFSIGDFADIDVSDVEPLKINSTCTVFAESEVISMVSRDIPAKVIISSIARMVALNTISMAKKIHPQAPVFMSGGVSRLKPVRFHLGRLLALNIGADINSQIMGALGAAVFARKEAQ